MTLMDLIDLEAQLARDRRVELSVLEARDRSLLGVRGEGGSPPLTRDALLARWLSALRELAPGDFFPGSGVASALGLLKGLLAVIGLTLGWTAATTVLHYTGGHPVNVWDFLLGFVGLQLLLLALLAVTFLVPMAAFGAAPSSAVRSLLRAVYPWLAARGATERTEQWRALWHRLRARRSLYHRVEPWLLVSLSQTLGVAFNLGALAALARLVVFSDLAFSWSTTLVELDPHRFHELVSLLAAPFGWAIPQAVPSVELVEATRYGRLEGAYLLSGTSGAGRSATPALVGGWWPFLTAALACYGLAPRLVLLALARGVTTWTLARLPLDDVEVSRVVHRLSEPHVETQSLTPEPTSGAPSSSSLATSAPGSSSAPSPGARCAVVVWRDLPSSPELQAALRQTTGCEVADAHAAGGVDFDTEVDDWGGRLAGVDRVALVAEGWEAPDRSVRRFLETLRRAVGPRRPVTVWLVDEAETGVRPAAPAQLALWREVLGRLEDPYLAVEPLGAAR